MEARERLIRILEVLTSRDIVAPGDVVVETGLPRYMVLAVMQCLEALGVIEQVYAKGSHKLYAATPLAAKLLHALKAGATRPVEELVEASASHGASVQAEA